MLRHTKQIAGFTVIELIVVIMMIGIIATIGLVSYNSVLVSARNTDRLNELKAWENAFTLYAQLKRSYPSVPAHNTYCLGTDFPSASDIAPHLPTGSPSITPPSANGYCGNLLGAAANRYTPSDSLNAKLLDITEKKPGSASFKATQFNNWPTAIGPYAKFESGNKITLSHIFEGDSCPDSTSQTSTYASGRRMVCSIVLPSNYSYSIAP